MVVIPVSKRPLLRAFYGQKWGKIEIFVPFAQREIMVQQITLIFRFLSTALTGKSEQTNWNTLPSVGDFFSSWTS